MLKILFPTGSIYPSQEGGPSNTVHWITKGLVKKGITTIICSTARGIKPQHNIRINRWMENNNSKILYQNSFIHYLPFTLLIKTISKIRDVDIVHLTNIFYPLSWSIAIITTIFYPNKPIVWSARGELDPSALVYSKWKKIPLLFVIRRLLKKRIIFHSTCIEETNYIRNNFGYKTKIVCIPNYMLLPKLIKIYKQPYLLFLGRIHPKKALENLLKAIANSTRIISSNFSLKVAGDFNNEYGDSLMKWVSEHKLNHKIEFLGHIEGKDKQTIIAAARCLVMPSHTENFGNVVIEALAQSTPVIASKGTPWEILQQKKAGFWVDNNPESLGKAIEKIIEMPDMEYEQYSKNALQLVHEEFDILNKVSDWVEVYSSATNNS